MCQPKTFPVPNLFLGTDQSCPPLPHLGTGAALADFYPFTMGFSHGNRGLEKTPQGFPEFQKQHSHPVHIWGSHAQGDGRAAKESLEYLSLLCLSTSRCPPYPALRTNFQERGVEEDENFIHSQPMAYIVSGSWFLVLLSLASCFLRLPPS